mgnify:CR=1 FL=1
MTMTARDAGLLPLDHFRDAHLPVSHSVRLERLRSLAPQFKKEFVARKPVIAVRTLDVSMAPYQVSYAFNRACRLPYPFLVFQNRSLLVQFHQRGARKLLLLNPTIPLRSAEAPYFKDLQQKLPFAETIRDRLLLSTPVDLQLRNHGFTPQDVDYVAFDHQHVQDLRPYLGAPGTARVYPNAKYLVQTPDFEASVNPHPMQKHWFIPGGGDGVQTDNLVLLQGDVELGDGCVLLYTPGHTWGNQSLFFRAPDTGCYTVSENGVCMDAYTPEHSTIPGLAAHARHTGEEVILNANTLEGSLDQYNSMVKEKLLADPYARDGRFVQHFSSSELVHSPLAPGLRATHAIRRVDEGVFERVAEKRAANGVAATA